MPLLEQAKVVHDNKNQIIALLNEIEQKPKIKPFEWKKNGWISINKRKPKPGRLVMIYTPNETILKTHTLLGIYWKETKDWTVYDFSGSYKDYIVTHWRSLPSKP